MLPEDSFLPFCSFCFGTLDPLWGLGHLIQSGREERRELWGWEMGGNRTDYRQAIPWVEPGEGDLGSFQRKHKSCWLTPGLVDCHRILRRKNSRSHDLRN